MWTQPPFSDLLPTPKSSPGRPTLLIVALALHQTEEVVVGTWLFEYHEEEWDFTPCDKATALKIVSSSSYESYGVEMELRFCTVTVITAHDLYKKPGGV